MLKSGHASQYHQRTRRRGVLLEAVKAPVEFFVGALH
jgi:hypothetical protein